MPGIAARFDRLYERLTHVGYDEIGERVLVAAPECFQDHAIGRFCALNELTDIKGRIGSDQCAQARLSEAIRNGATPDDQLTAAPQITLPGTNTTLENYDGTQCGGGATSSKRTTAAFCCSEYVTVAAPPPTTSVVAVRLSLAISTCSVESVEAS